MKMTRDNRIFNKILSDLEKISRASWDKITIKHGTNSLATRYRCAR